MFWKKKKFIIEYHVYESTTNCFEARYSRFSNAIKHLEMNVKESDVYGHYIQKVYYLKPKLKLKKKKE